MDKPVLIIKQPVPPKLPKLTKKQKTEMAEMIALKLIENGVGFFYLEDDTFVFATVRHATNIH
jgi:hypothetical protein